MKKSVKISNNYISVMYNGIPSYGGSQLWFDGDMHKCGCGVIAAADVLMYLKHRKSTEPVQDDTADKVHNKLMSSLGKLCKAPALCRRYIKLDKHDTSETADKFRRSDAVPSYKEIVPEKSCGNVIKYDAYIRYTDKLRPAFPMIPGRGIPCFLLALYMKIYMLITGLPYRVHFGTGIGTDRSITSCIIDMLAHDIPVILCIGPGVHQFMKPKTERGIMLYSRSETVRCTAGCDDISSDGNNISADIASAGSVSHDEAYGKVYPEDTSCECLSADAAAQTAEYKYTPVKRVRSHFVVITEIDGDYAKVSSWGKPYCISVAELTHYAKLDMFGLFTNIVRISQKES